MKNYFRWFTPTQSPVGEKEQKAGAADERKSSSPFSMFAMSGSGYARWSQTDYTTMARKGYMANPVVYRCVRMICETAAAIPLLVYSAKQELDEHPTLDLLKRPSPHQSGKDFLEKVVGNLLISGNAFVELIEIENAPRELHALRPDRVKIMTDKNGWTEGFEYSNGSQKIRHLVDPAGRSPILHLNLFHPLDDQLGFPPLQAAMMALDVHNAASQWNKALLDNSARPSGALVYSSTSGANLSEDQFTRLKSELEEGYTGASRAGRPMLLEGGLDWKAMGYSPKDMDFIDARNSAARDIALAFGVPPMLLGIPGDNTYSNYQEANRAFMRQTLLPMINRTLEAFNHWLQPRFGDGAFMAIDEDRIWGLSQERDAVWKRLNEASFLSDAEKRQAVGYSPEEPRQGQ